MPRKKSIQIVIPTPCTQGWDGMEKATGGRYCQACEKTVIDFSQLTDDEILQVFSKAKGNLCGHFRASQLNREIAPLHTSPRYPFISRIAMAGAVLAGFFNTSAAAQLPEKPTTEWQNAKKGELLEAQNSDGDSVKYILGKVTDTLNVPIPFVNVIVSVGDKFYSNVVTNEDGYFRISLPADFQQDIVFDFKVIGYESKRLQIPHKSSYKFMYVKMEEIDMTLDGDIIVIKKTEKPGFWSRLENWFRKR